MKNLFFGIISFLLGSLMYAQDQNYSKHDTIDVLIIGGGASGTMAGIQSARLGVSTLIVEETPWLGGMLTSAGVSAIDGNYELHSGLWEEFRLKLNVYYGGAENLKTGWVSNVLFEPHVGARILREMTEKEEDLSVWHHSNLSLIQKREDLWYVVIDKDGETKEMLVKIVIDATELGDVSKEVGIPYDIGMDSRNDTGEEIAPKVANDIVQDLTYVAILKDYGAKADMTIEKPKNYDPAPFLCTCKGTCDEAQTQGRAQWDCDHMMNYGKLPNGYYMINWPLFGNDYYLNILEMSRQERKEALKKAKNFTLNYVYYLQSELGYKHLGIADDVFQTEDKLPFIPYHRESRRIKGLVQFDINDLASPYEQDDALYRTGIAVGDYPIDHHHFAYPEFQKLPDLHFYPVPSYTIPLGTLIPKDEDNFIVSEKSISVTNLVNGTTRLQPVCILIGQASGALAALSVKQNTTPKNVSVRALQKALLNADVYLMPYSDISHTDSSFEAFQRIGVTGILKGEGKNIGWKNHTNIYPDSLLSAKALRKGLVGWTNVNELNFTKEIVTYKDLLMVIIQINKETIQQEKKSLKQLKDQGDLVFISHKLLEVSFDGSLSRKHAAVLLDELLNPFDMRDVNHFGDLMPISKRKKPKN